MVDVVFDDTLLFQIQGLLIYLLDILGMNYNLTC